jgi:hypothetical protein
LLPSTNDADDVPSYLARCRVTAAHLFEDMSHLAGCRMTTPHANEALRHLVGRPSRSTATDARATAQLTGFEGAFR